MDEQKEKVLVIVGPTASGKTAAAVAVARQLNGEIISADSMQIYREMTIGTAKPSPEEMAGVPHHMIDCVSPEMPYSVAEYVTAAQNCIRTILDRGRVPIVCGGTGLYINGLTLPWAFGEDHKDEAIRHTLEVRADEEGPESLYRALWEVDPETAKALHPHNVKRVIRALEIYEVTGRPKSYWDQINADQPLLYDYVMTGLQWDRAVLYQRINDRVDQMMAAGLLAEVKTLLEKGYSPALTAMQAIGYKEFIPLLRGEVSLDGTLRVLKRDTRHFAKRQLTWFRKDQRIQWFNPSEYADVRELASSIIRVYQNHQ